MFVEITAADMCSDALAEQLEQALAQFLEGDFREKWETSKQLVELGPAAIAYLVPLLQDEASDWEVRWFAARTLGQFEHPDALQALIDLLQQQPDPDVLTMAAEGLSHFGDAGIKALIELLEQPEYRLIAVQVLASIQHSSVFVPLLTAAEDADPAIRAKAIAALGNFHHEEVDKLLIGTVRDPSMIVRREAIAALGVRHHLLTQVNLVDLLLPGLWDVRPEINQATAIALGKLGTETAVAALARVLSSPHTPDNLQADIISALGWIERASALRALIAALRQLSGSLQVQVVETLTRLQTPQLQQRAGDALCDWLKTYLLLPTADNQLIATIALALGTLHYQPAMLVLTDLQTHDDPKVQLYATAALRYFADEAGPG
ncbi:HEAT repeat domain-containing protein [Leptolyngbya iicbica]|nr:HEAT repeat domain-containing protein [Leptolyngbya sp. LK]